MSRKKQKVEIPELYKCVTIDVGKHTGIAIWNGTFFPEVHTINYGKKIKGNIELYLETMSKYVYPLLNHYSFLCYQKLSSDKLSFIQIEGTELWEKSSKSLTSATRGDLFTVSYLVGVYFQIALQFTDDIRISTARQWKKQLSKEGTAARIKRINGMTYKNEHIADAVAMGFANVEDIWYLKRSRK